MIRNTFILVSLLSYSILMYFPLNKKEIDLNNDDLCYYKENDNKKYVKACNEGYYCKILDKNENKGICLEYNPIVKNYKEECIEDSQCFSDLKCINNKCVKGNDHPYVYKDKVSELKYYYCDDNDNILYDHQACGKITQPETTKDKCILPYVYLKVCGELNEDHLSYSNSDFGIVENNKFVGDVLACKSGFTLYFYDDGEIQYNHINKGISFPACVTVKNVDLDIDDECIISYTKEDENELIYSRKNVNETLYNKNDFPDCNLIMTKIELFKNYLNIFNKLKNHCQKEQFYNEPFTCKNDELRKSWYFYNHPEDYLLYKDEEEIIDYLIQKYYPSHKSNETEQENEISSSGFLNNKYFLFLLLLFI